MTVEQLFLGAWISSMPGLLFSFGRFHVSSSVSKNSPPEPKLTLIILLIVLSSTTDLRLSEAVIYLRAHAGGMEKRSQELDVLTQLITFRAFSSACKATSSSFRRWPAAAKARKSVISVLADST